MKTDDYFPLSEAIGVAKTHGVSGLRSFLPSYFEAFSETWLARMISFWERLGAYVLESKSLPSLLFCQSDGSKALLIKSRGEVLLKILRSGVVDQRYLGILASHLGQEVECFRRRFEEIPSLSAGALAHIPRSVRSEEGVAQDVEMYLNHYSKGDAYGIDIRIFAVLHALRVALCHMDIHLLLVDRGDTQQSAGLSRLYVYRTHEALPQRPPIFASRTLPRYREIVDSVPHETEITLGQESLIGKAVQQQINIIGTSYAVRLDIKEANSIGLLELSGKGVDPSEREFARKAIAAALDPTDRIAFETLERISGLNSSRQLREFRRYLFLYSRGLCSSKGEWKADEEWFSAVQQLRHDVGTVYPGSLSPRDLSQLRAVLSALNTAGTRAMFSRERFDKELTTFVTARHPRSRIPISAEG
jgi:hypothetical protein